MDDGAPSPLGGGQRARATLWRLYETGDASDVSFVSAGGGRVFRLHRLLLSQASPVLTAMLSSAFKEASACGGSAPVVIGDSSPRALAALFEHMYGGDLPPPVAADSAFFCEVWELAHRFEVAALEDAAREAARALLPRQPLSAFAVLAVARGLRDTSMVKAARVELARDLELLARCPLFVELAAEDVRAVLALAARGDGERCASLRAMFEAAMRWVEADPEEREPEADSLFLYLDLGAASMQEVEAMVARPVANSSSVLMCKIVAGPLARVRKERRQLSRQIEALRVREGVREREGARLVARVESLQSENESIRRQVSVSDGSDRPASIEQMAGVQQAGIGEGVGGAMLQGAMSGGDGGWGEGFGQQGWGELGERGQSSDSGWGGGFVAGGGQWMYGASERLRSGQWGRNSAAGYGSPSMLSWGEGSVPRAEVPGFGQHFYPQHGAELQSTQRSNALQPQWATQSPWASPVTWHASMPQTSMTSLPQQATGWQQAYW